MQRKRTTIGLWVGLMALVSVASYAQQHDHSQQTNRSKASTSVQEEEAIFCPTMKTGQLCSHGTATILQLSGEKHERWIEAAQKYDRAVDAATLQLFKDAENVLTPAQLDHLKAWFAVGLNPEINQLLYSKGLGPQKH